MESLDGIERLHMSGARAVFVPVRKGGPSDAEIVAAFEEKGMTVEKISKERRPRAAATVVVDAGVT